MSEVLRSMASTVLKKLTVHYVGQSGFDLDVKSKLQVPRTAPLPHLRQVYCILHPHQLEFLTFLSTVAPTIHEL